MAQTATIYLLKVKDLKSLEDFGYSRDDPQKNWLGLPKLKSTSFIRQLDNVAVEKINYRWSGIAFVVLTVFSKETIGVDWDNLEYAGLSNGLTEKWELGIYIFSIRDEQLLKLKPNGLFYTMRELDEFAIEFHGQKPYNREIMKNAVETLQQSFSRLTRDRVVLLLIN